MSAGGISVHAVDVAHGRIATGLGVAIVALENGERLVGSGAIGDNGSLDHPSVRGEGVTSGIYEVRFSVGAYFLAQGVKGGILDVVPFRFVINDAAQHYHLPFKFTPFGFSLFRGA